jgi:hypothetical protein
MTVDRFHPLVFSSRDNGKEQLRCLPGIYSMICPKFAREVVDDILEGAPFVYRSCGAEWCRMEGTEFALTNANSISETKVSSDTLYPEDLRCDTLGVAMAVGDERATLLSKHEDRKCCLE